MDSITRVNTIVPIYSDLPKDTHPSSGSSWIPAVILSFPKQYSLTELQGLMSDSANVPIWWLCPEKDHLPSAHCWWGYVAVCPESRGPQAEPQDGTIHLTRKSGRLAATWSLSEPAVSPPFVWTYQNLSLSNETFWWSIFAARMIIGLHCSINNLYCTSATRYTLKKFDFQALEKLHFLISLIPIQTPSCEQRPTSYNIYHISGGYLGTWSLKEGS